MRRIAIVLLLLSAVLLAETQEAAYFRAMQAEKDGDISLAIKSFEEALSIGGEYTDEISEILDEYYDALGIAPEDHRKSDEITPSESQTLASPWSFRFLGELSALGVLYSASRSDVGLGAVFQGAASIYGDYSRGNAIHSFGLNLLGDMNFNNDDVPALDTNDWKGSLGMEYSLVAENLLLDVGIDLNVLQQEDLSSSFYAWLEYDFYKQNKHRVGAVLWIYNDETGPTSVSLYGAWRKNTTYGFSFSAMAGLRFEADSVYDYQAYAKAYDDALDAAEKELDNEGWFGPEKNPFDQCLELYGDECFGWSIAVIDSLNWVARYQELLSGINVEPTKYWAKWLGPSLRLKALYRFRGGFSLDARANLFYSLVVDGPDSDYEKISRLNVSLSGSVCWNVGPSELYLMVEDSYKMYGLPKAYRNMYSTHTNVLKLKLGSRWDF